MQARDLQPGAWHWTALVKAWCRADMLPQALAAVDEMVQAGVPPITPTWDVLTRKAAIMGGPDVVELVRDSTRSTLTCPTHDS